MILFLSLPTSVCIYFYFVTKIVLSGLELYKVLYKTKTEEIKVIFYCRIIALRIISIHNIKE